MAGRILTVAAVAIAWALAYWWWRLRRRKRLASYSAQLAGDVPLLLAVVSKHCRLCPAQKQILRQLAEQRAGSIRIEILDAEENVERVRTLGIMTVPATLLFAADGTLARSNSGLVSFSALEAQVAGLSEGRDV
jgi:thioredoxin-like negative regulator of GroEL